MGLKFNIVEPKSSGAKIKVVGAGGCGNNALNTMIEEGVQGVEFIACNTDRQALDNNMAGIKVQLGAGLGAGGKPEIGRREAESSIDKLREVLEGADMVFITAGMGGGTGTGAAPVIAKLSREIGALTVAVVTKPFLYEARHRMRIAEEGIKELREEVDTIIVIPNQKLLAVAGADTTLMEAFRKANDVLLKGVKSISDLIIEQGHVNLDFADVKSVMKATESSGELALMGTGQATGDKRAVDAAAEAISCPTDGKRQHRRGARGAYQHHWRLRPEIVRGQRGGRVDYELVLGGRGDLLGPGDRRDDERRGTSDRDRHWIRRSAARISSPGPRPRRSTVRANPKRSTRRPRTMFVRSNTRSTVERRSNVA